MITKKPTSGKTAQSKSAGAKTSTRTKVSAIAKNTPKKTTDTNGKMQASQLMKLFEDGVKDIYWAEKALTKAIPKMVKKATSKKLKDALEAHLHETKDHVIRIEQIFEVLGKKASAVKCDAMAGLITEAEVIIEDCETGPMRDAGIIAAAQKVEHYEIASYGTLRQFAETLKLSKAFKLLDKTLQEEKMVDIKLSELAMDTINMDAAKKQA